MILICHKLCLASFATAFLLCACGGGGGGSASSEPVPPPAVDIPATPLNTVSTVVQNINGIQEVVKDSAGNWFATSSWQCIYKITPDGTWRVFAGSTGQIPEYVDGTGTEARFYWPTGLAIDGSDNLYVAERGNHTIRKITPAGVVTTLAGSGRSAAGYGRDPGYVDATGTMARFNKPTGIVCADDGMLYVTEEGNRRVRQVTPSGVVTTLAGSGTMGNADGTGSAASFDFPSGITLHGDSPIYVSDFNSHVIRKITRAGVVTTLAGIAGVAGQNDGAGAAATFNQPVSISLDQAGNLYVADSGGPTIRKVTPAGTVTTVAGQKGVSGVYDGAISAALFRRPLCVRVIGTKIYVVDYRFDSLRVIE